MKKFSVEVSKSGQNADYLEIGELNGHKVKIAIHTDTYKFQGSARAYVWSKTDLKWNEAGRILAERMQTDKNLSYRQVPPKASDFATDRAELVSQLAFILG